MKIQIMNLLVGFGEKCLIRPRKLRSEKQNTESKKKKDSKKNTDMKKKTVPTKKSNVRKKR